MTSLQTQIEAHAFRALLAHLRARNDVQNIDLMNLSGFCRNCCAKWTLLGAQKVGFPMTYDEATEYVYGEPYSEWKKKHQAKATEEQMAAFNANQHLHAKHDGLDMDKAKSSNVVVVGAAAAGGMAPIVSGELSEVCCTPAEALIGGGGVQSCERVAASGASGGVRVGVLTTSDRASAGVYADESGPTVVRAITEYANASGAFTITDVHTALVPDDEAAVEAALRDLSSKCNLVLTTGGTGCAPRDITPEATSRVISRHIPGLPEAIRAATSIVEPRAALSRALAGVADSGALILNLPGAPAAAKQCLAVALPLLPRLLQTLNESSSS
jgi:molybdenum cofactor synthesis domain-containing protein